MIMKKLLPVFIISLLVFVQGCQSSKQKEAQQTMNDIQAAVKENTPGTVPASENGFYMKAKINGKDWVAKDMLPNNNEDTRPIFGEADGQKISFTIWMQHPKEGCKETFSDHDVADLFGFEDVAIWGGTKGEAIVTKIDDHAVEGTFFITATSHESDKTLEITDGFFRIPVEK
jgi:hypothetical protein